MALKIRLSRYGKKKSPYYRVIVVESERRRDYGRYLEAVGWYEPQRKDKIFDAKKDRVDYWIGKGATATDTVASLLKTLV